MQILLKCRDVSGQVAFHADHIDGLLAPERRYQIQDHQIILEGHPDSILHADCDALLAMPNGLYRMLTPAEQDVLFQAQQASVSVQEQASADSAPSEPAQEAVSEDASAESADTEQLAEEPDDSPPALLDKIKKIAVGG